MLRLLRGQGGVARINLNGRPWHKVVAGAPDHVREQLVGCGIQSCHLEVDEKNRSSFPPYAPLPFFSFTRVDRSKASYSPLDAATQAAPRSPPRTQRPGRSRSREKQLIRGTTSREGAVRPRPGPAVPVGRPVFAPPAQPSSIYGGHQPETQDDDDEWELVTLEEDDEKDENDQNGYIQREQVPGHWTSMGPIGAPPDLDLTHLSRDRRPGGLGGPQRELLKEAVQCNGRHLRKLDPAMCPEAEWHWKSLVQWLELDDLRLKCGHASISRHFSHGEHKGQPVQQLVIDLQMGRLHPQELPALVAVETAAAGELFVVCGNRRWFAVQQFAKATPPWKRPRCWVRVIVHDFPQLTAISDPEQRSAFLLKAIQAVDGNGERPRMR